MNANVRILDETLLSDSWYTLKKVTFQYRTRSGQWEMQSREAYDRGNGATILLYNPGRDTVILTRQFRLPTYLNGNSTGLLIETCAGLLDNDNPEDAIRRETEEETGFRIENVRRVFDAYMSPGSVTEKLFFFMADYTDETQRSAGGGIDEEDIDVLELPRSEAVAMITSGAIQDGKTIMLLQHLQITQFLKANSLRA